MAFSIYRRADERPAMKRKAFIKNWEILGQGNMWPQLCGTVYGHESARDGQTCFITSPILRLDIPRHEAETMHTVYLLGEGKR